MARGGARGVARGVARNFGLFKNVFHMAKTNGLFKNVFLHGELSVSRPSSCKKKQKSKEIVHATWRAITPIKFRFVEVFRSTWAMADLDSLKPTNRSEPNVLSTLLFRHPNSPFNSKISQVKPGEAG